MLKKLEKTLFLLKIQGSIKENNNNNNNNNKIK